MVHKRIATRKVNTSNIYPLFAIVQGISFAMPGKEIQVVSGIMPFTVDFEIIGNAINLAARMASPKVDPTAEKRAGGTEWPPARAPETFRICCDNSVVLLVCRLTLFVSVVLYVF